MKLFSQNKEPSDPALIITNCLKTTLNRITDQFEEEGYHWAKPWGVKRFESMILAKFMLDNAFNRLAEDKLKDDEKIAFDNLSNSAFSKMFDDEFSEVGLNYEDMQEEIQNKIEGYLSVLRESRPPKRWHEIYTLITKSKTKEELEEDIKNKSAGLQLIQGNENFAGMVPQYKVQIKVLKDKAGAFESAEMMLPHMARFTKDKLKSLNLKKITLLHALNCLSSPTDG